MKRQSLPIARRMASRDSQHKKMMPILPKLPFPIGEGEKRFFGLIKEFKLFEAFTMINNKSISIDAHDEYGLNILNYATFLLRRENLDFRNKNILFKLIGIAIEKGVVIRINYSNYDSPLHEIARIKNEEVALEVLKIVLPKVRPEYLNAYNKRGHTPLLEAIAAAHEKIALKFLERPELNVNLIKIMEIRHISGLRLGSSAYDAAESQKMHNLAENIQKHNSYHSGFKYIYPSSGDIIRKEHFLFAEQGNVDTLKVLFKHYEIETLMEADELYWTMLNIASFAGNIPIVEFLLDKKKLDDAAGIVISEDIYKSFINRKSDVWFTALGRVMFAAGQDYDMKKEEQIELYIRCKYFHINEWQDAFGDAPIHYIAKRNLLGLILILSDRNDADFEVQNLRGQTALEIAALRGNHDMVALLSNLAKIGKVIINPNKYNRNCKLADYCSHFMEEKWFGDVSIEGLSLDDLIEIYRTKESHEIKITYPEYVFDIKIEFLSEVDSERKKLIIQHLQYCFIRVQHCREMIYIVNPSWLNEELYDAIINELEAKLHTSFDMLIGSTILLKDICIKMCIDGVQFELTSKVTGTKQVTRSGRIEYEQLCSLLEVCSSLDNLDNEETRHKLLHSEYRPLLAMVVEKAQADDISAEKRGKYIQVFKELVNFPGVKLNITVITNSYIGGIDDIIKLERLKEILNKARQKQITSLLLPKNKHILYEKLSNKTNENSSLYEFAKIFVNTIETLNIGRHFKPLSAEKLHRRLDSLARLLEGVGICSAVFFDGIKILYSTNSKFQVLPKQYEFMKEIFEYFSSSMELEKKLKLIEYSVIIKLLRKSSEKKAILQRKYIVDPILHKLCKNLTNLQKAFNLREINLDKYGLLTDTTFLKILEICQISQNEYEKMNLTDTGEKILNNSESYRKFANALIKDFIKTLVDFNKIESYIRENPTDKLVMALTKNNTENVMPDIEMHAEMKLVQYMLKNYASSPDDKQFYIGISKLCCAHCNLVLQNYAKSSAYLSIETRGTHSEDSRWPLPEFMKNPEEFRKIFQSDKELCDKFEISFKSSPQDTCLFIEEYAVLKDKHRLDFLYESLERGRRNQEHAWSESVPFSEEKAIPGQDEKGMVDRHRLEPTSPLQRYGSQDEDADTKSHLDLQEERLVTKDDFEAYNLFQFSLFPSSSDLTNNSQQLGWNCFDIAVDLAEAFGIRESDPGKRAVATREKLVNYALTYSDDIEYRRLLAPEIRHAAALTTVYMNMKDNQTNEIDQRNIRLIELFGVSEALNGTSEQASAFKEIEKLISQEHISEELSELQAHILPHSMHTPKLKELVNRYHDAHENPDMHKAVEECNDKIGRVVGQRFSIEELRVFFEDSENASQYEEAEAIFSKAFQDILLPCENALNEYCSRKVVYERYIRDYYGRHGWVAFQLAFAGEHRVTSMVDIVARLLNAQIIIYSLGNKEQSEKVIYRTEWLGDRQINIQFDGSAHFTKFPSERPRSPKSTALCLPAAAGDQERKTSAGDKKEAQNLSSLVKLK